MGDRAFFNALHEPRLKTVSRPPDRELTKAERLSSQKWWQRQTGKSSLNGVIDTLRNKKPLTNRQIDEIERTLQALADEGWSGSIPADHAVRALIKSS